MRMLCSTTLLAEFFVIGFAGLVAMKDPDLTAATVWTVCGVLMAVSLLLCGIVGKPLGVRLGWGLQIALVVSGVYVPMMFVLGLCFGGLWWASLHFGRKVDEAKAHWAALSEDGTVTPGPDAA
ncbi:MULTISPECIES: DUF4233 domain-containing protein [unclassified Streptomyces]|uniref:DUF4233 domain-containing protein n=1 Tax=Streptomyces sp. NPDC005955 TaxID=3364738 RepID=UPI00369E7CBC